jgi:hypothetical protein
LIAGKGELEYLINNIKDNRVKYLGFLENPESIYSETHAFILTSRFEPFGISTLEALSSENYVISNKTFGSLTIKEKIGEGIIICDYSSLLQNLENLYNLFFKDKKKFIEICKRSRKKIIRHFSENIEFKKFEKMILEVLMNET